MDDDQSIIILIFVGSNKQALTSKIDFESIKPRRALKTSRVLLRVGGTEVKSTYV